jgi:hypothetical protein
MLNQAQSLENLNQYTKAQTIYEDLIKRYPNDIDVINRLLNSYLRVSEFEKVNSLIESKKPVLDPALYIRYKITYLIKINEISEAKKISDNYLKTNPNLINNYTLLANVFESNQLFEIANDYYFSGRKISNNPNLYSYELSNNYYQLRDYRLSIRESVTYLKQNKGFIYFMSTRFKEIVKNDSTMINFIKDNCESSENEEIRELYALSLCELKYYDRALAVYNTLPLDKYLRFADDLFSSGNFSVASRAYIQIVQKSEDNLRNADIFLKLAQISISEKDLIQAKQYLTKIAQIPELSDKRFMYKSRAHINARMLLANILIQENASREAVLNCFDEAAKYSFNKADQNNVEFSKINYLIMCEDFNSANKRLNNLISHEEKGSPVLAQSYYYQYLIFSMQSDSRADSLLTEYIIYFPDNPVTNDVMFMSLFLSSIPKDSKPQFFNAFRKKNLYQSSQAITLLSALVENCKDDELTLLLADWYLDDNNKIKAKELYSLNYKNSVYNEYARLALSRLEDEKEKQILIVKDYLNNSPNSAFSPLFRNLLLNQNIKP